MISMTFTGPFLQILQAPFRKVVVFYNRDRQNRHLDSEQFRFVPRTCPSVRWQAESAALRPQGVSHHERAGRRGETGLGFRHRLGHAVFDGSPTDYGSVGTRSGLRPRRHPALDVPPTQLASADEVIE